MLFRSGKNGYTVSNAAVYILVTVPRRMYEMFPNAALIGGLLGLGALASSGELTALRAAGMSRMRIAASAAGVVAVLLVAVVVMGETVGPWGDQQAQAMQLRMKSGNLGLTNGSGLWARDGDRIINARASMLRHEDGHSEVQLADVRVFTLTPDGQLSRFDWAKTAEHVGGQWVLNNVRTTTLDDKGTHSSQSARVLWASHLNPRILEQSLIQPQYLPMRDLHRSMRYLESNGENPGPYAIAFWARALYPFNVLVLVLCAMPFAFGTLRSGGLGKRIFIGMLRRTILALGLASAAAENCGGSLSLDPRYCVGTVDNDGVTRYCDSTAILEGDIVPLRIRVTNNANYENLDADSIYVPAQLVGGKTMQIVFACIEACTDPEGNVETCTDANIATKTPASNCKDALGDILAQDTKPPEWDDDLKCRGPRVRRSAGQVRDGRLPQHLRRRPALRRHRRRKPRYYVWLHHHL